MMERQRVLLNLLDLLQRKNRYSKTSACKRLFLLCKEYDFSTKLKFYSFYPYRFGPFSELFYYDMRKLENEGYLANEEVTKKGIDEARKINVSLAGSILEVTNRFANTDSVKKYVYSKYPEYTVISELEHEKPKKLAPGVYTIGYEGKDIDAFLDILIRNQIQLVADVRFNPFSMQFAYIKTKLEHYLNKVGIEYVHIPELGIPGALRAQLNTDEDYATLFAVYRKDILKRENIEKFTKYAKGKRAVLLCMEKDSTHCHRRVIAEKLEQMDFPVTHL